MSIALRMLPSDPLEDRTISAALCALPCLDRRL